MQTQRAAPIHQESRLGPYPSFGGIMALASLVISPKAKTDWAHRFWSSFALPTVMGWPFLS
eukprot:12608860-Alexandrium_andersonii.AAC.1